MTDRTLREKIAALLTDAPPMQPEQKLAWHLAIQRALLVIDLDAAQPAPELCDVCGGHGMAGHPDSGYLCSRCHGSGGIKPAPDAVAEADDALLSDAYIAMRDAMGVIDANEGPGMKHSRILNALADARVRIERRTSAKGPSA